ASWFSPWLQPGGSIRTISCRAEDRQPRSSWLHCGPAHRTRRSARSPASNEGAARQLALGGVELAGVCEGGGALPVAGAGHRLAVDGDRVVDAHHHEVARVGTPQCGLHGGHLVEDLVDADRLAGALVLRPT